MYSCLRHFSLSVLIVAMPLTVLSQDISNFSYKLAGEKIEISYHLSGQPSDRYKVELFNSLDNYTNAMKFVSGDVGDVITPGKDKKIVWEAKKELGDFRGGLALKLKTEFIPFIVFNIQEGDKFIMGKENIISWQGEVANLTLELYQNNNKISDIGKVNSEGQYNWSLPKKSFEKGSNYSIKGTANGRIATSKPVTLKNKLPVYVYIIPVVVVVGVVGILSGGSNGGENPGDNTIPEPIGPD